MPREAQRKSNSGNVPPAQPLPSATQRYDVFLSHRFLDQAAVDALYQHIWNDLGYTVYVDWKEDPGLDRSQVDRAT
ncbi:MAG TPA: hypothetical protein VIP05_31485, partial [Burkholderiaceae bacterium]